MKNEDNKVFEKQFSCLPFDTQKQMKFNQFFLDLFT